MKLLVKQVVVAMILNKAWGLPLLQNNVNPYLPNNLGVNNLATTGFTSAIGPFGINNLAPNAIASANYLPNCGNPILANDAVVNTNMFANTILANEALGALPNGIANANFLPNLGFESGITNMQFTPILSEIVPSLQYGDITMTGELPVGGTIKVCGCIPVYGMISVDGAVPSAGTAVVAESFGNQLAEVISNCANQYLI